MAAMMPLLALALVAQGVQSGPPPPGPTPTCAAAEERLCAAAKAHGPKQCGDCLQTNSAALMKASRYASDEIRYFCDLAFALYL
jgi:hypothetical protein